MNALKTISKILLILFSFVFALVGVLGAYAGYKKVTDLETWQPLMVTVVSTSIEKSHRPKGVTFCPVVKVRYTFLGRQQISRLDIEDGPCSPIKSSVIRIIEIYKQGTVVNAFVNPEDPSLVRVANFSLGINFYLMLFMIILGFSGVVYLWRTPTDKLFNRDNKKATHS